MDSIKILVCHHKDENILKQYLEYPNLYVHVFGGKDLYVGESEMLLNMLGDNTGENISKFNRELNELTVLYWAWKNYDKIGNPSYIGLNHYRRCFEPLSIIKALQYDIAVYENILTPELISIPVKTMYDQFTYWHSDKQLNMFFDKAKDMKVHFNVQCFHPKNMFIMKKRLFFNYMEQLSKYMKICLDLFPYKDGMAFTEGRTASFICERISSIIFESMIQKYPNFLIKIPKQYI